MNDREHEAETILAVDGVGKVFPVLNNTWDGVRYLWNIARGQPGKLRGIPHVAALDDVSFSIKPGERVGLIGRNGSGKTTMLRLIAGSLMASDGQIEVGQDIYLLSGSTVTFNADATVRENVIDFLAGHEADPSMIQSKLAEIEQFVELDMYFNQPVKYCSLGMQARAAFAAATAVDASLILVDEVLGAGDLHWAERCAQRVEEFCAQGRALLLVSHSMAQVLRYCERVIWIDSGRIVMDGDVHEVVRRYEGFLERLTWLGDDIEDKTFNWETERQFYEDVVLEDSGSQASRWPGIGNVTVNGLWLNGSPGLQQDVYREDPIDFEMSLRCNRPGSFRLRYTLTFWSPTGKRMGVAENDYDEVSLRPSQTHKVALTISGSIIGHGTYYVTLSIFRIGIGGSTAIEQDSREDVIYKSIRLTVSSRGSEEDHDAVRPRFTAPFEVRLVEPACVA